MVAGFAAPASADAAGGAQATLTPGARTVSPPSLAAPKRVWRIDDAGARSEGPDAVSPTALRHERCVGKDLVQSLKASDPDVFDKLEDAARRVLNSEGLLWRVGKGDGSVSYLFGTMHSSDAPAKTYDALVSQALERSRVVALELPGASSRRVATELRRLVANRSFRAQGGSLRAMPDEVRPAVERRIAEAGIPPAVAGQLQPWFLALAVSRSNCATPVNGDPETADARIERLATERGAEVLALETPLEQVEALASVPDEVALRMIRDATEKGMRPEDVESTISGLYQTRRIGYLLAMRGPAWAGVFDVDGYADFLSAFITRRNVAMMERALPILREGRAFLAVGALHLPGEMGLVEMIRRAGYSVDRLW